MEATLQKHKTKKKSVKGAISIVSSEKLSKISERENPLELKTEYDSCDVKKSLQSVLNVTQCETKADIIKPSIICNIQENIHLPSYAVLDTKTNFQNLYPDLKSIQLSQQRSNITCAQALVKTYTHQYKTHTTVLANKSYQDFTQAIHGLDSHPLWDMIHGYRRAKHSELKLKKNIKYLNSDMKRKKELLWKSVKKEVFSKGKCEDGNNVTVSHSYIIKELDQNEFSELVRTLKDITDSIAQNAFNTYVENLSKRRIESYLCELVNSPQEFNESDSVSKTYFHSLKKCISILFDCQRQNPPDKIFIEMSQKWLNNLVFKLLENCSFSDKLFLINHILRCPNGVENWAVNFIQMPVDMCENDKFHNDCDCSQKFLLLLYIILSPVPFREKFLSNLKEYESSDGNFAVLDSDGEEEEVCEFYQKWSDDDIIALLRQIPLRSLYQQLLSDISESEALLSEDKMLKLFSYSTAIVDVLFTGMETYNSVDFPNLLDYLSHLIRHVLLYVTKYWDYQEKFNMEFKISLQVVYDKFFFHVIYELIRLKNWKILPGLPFNFISNKMLWNIMWIFSNPRSEEDIFSEKDVERKIKDDSIQIMLIDELKKTSLNNAWFVLNTLEKIALSSKSDEDFFEFLIKQIFEIVFVDQTLRDLSKEGCVILSSVTESNPQLISMLLKEIDKNAGAAMHTVSMFKCTNLQHWIPTDTDVCILSSWLLSNSLSEEKSYLARVILLHMNWNFNEEGLLCLPLTLHRRIALLVAEAYMKFDVSANEWLMSRGIKQMLQFTNIRSQQTNEESFVHWAWNLLFSLKLHPLDRKWPPWISIFDGSVDTLDTNSLNDTFSATLLADSKGKHPCILYLMIVMTDVGCNTKNLMKDGLDYLTSLMENQQYMACIRALYYVLPFFVKHPEFLLEDFRFLQFVINLITADMGILSNITSAPVIGAVLHNLASMIKHQIYQATECTVECAIPLLKLWMKILMKITVDDKNYKSKNKYSTRQVFFLLDILVRISYMHSYTRDCILEFLCSNCHASGLQVNIQTFWKRMFSSSPMYNTILDQNTVSEYPLLTWFILSSEVKQKSVFDLWTRVQNEVVKQKDPLVFESLKRAAADLKIEVPPLDCLPIYRWAYSITTMSPSHEACILFWQQFFLLFFKKVWSPNLQAYTSLGLKYFSEGPYMKLMERMKKQLISAIQYHRGFLTLPGSEDPSVHQKNDSESDKEPCLHTTVLKLYCAFELWISEVSLHEGNLCLSALEPKYCPNHLKLILDGDENPWFDMVPSISIKDDLEQKIKMWNVIKYFKNQPRIDLTEETLSKQLLRHIADYENPILNFPLNTLHSSDSINDNILSSEDDLIKVIEENQSVIFKKARYFAEQMKKMNQLNTNYLNWIPQEFTNEDCKINVRKPCCRGTGPNGCSGEASFILQIQKYVKDGRISQKIDSNRKDFVILQDQLTNLCVSDLCDAALLIENYISALSRKINAAKDEACRLKKMGVALFYYQIHVIDETLLSIAEYPPSQLFFSSIIDSLGKEFILGHDLQLQELVNAILNHHEAGKLALSLFNPSKSSTVCFQQVYQTLTLAIGKYSPSTVLSLLSKIDLSVWLQENCPSFDFRKEIFTYVCNALFSCGCCPSIDIYPIFEILKKHFKVVLMYMFPELFHETVSFLLKGIDNQLLSNDVFYEAFFCFGCPMFHNEASVEDIEIGLKNFSHNQQLPASQQLFLSTLQLSVMQVKYTSKTLYQYFTEKQISADLYKNHSCYIKEVGIFLAIISHSVVALQLDDTVTSNQTLDLWQDFHLPFIPWLHPVYTNGTISFPWSDKEIQMARYMFKVFTICLKYFHHQLLCTKTEDSVLSYLWNHYMQTYVSPGYRHYSFSLYHEEMLLLPWYQFHPSACDIEGMCKVLQSNMDESKVFLSKISLKIPWLHVMQNVTSTKNSDYVASVLALLGKLLVLSHLHSTDPEIRADSDPFKDFECLNWHLLSVEDVEELLNLYYENCEPIIFENKSSQQSMTVHRFLKLLCCMVPDVNNEEYSNSKRILYLQKYVSALNAYASGAKLVELKEVLPKLLSEIDNVICNGVIPDLQIKYAIPLVEEILKFLNLPSENEITSSLLNSLLSWLNTNTKSPLLLPCLKVSCSLHSISHVVLLSECCISARFSNEILGSCDARNVWHLISSFFNIPMCLYDEFSKTCIEENSFLTLYCYIMHNVIPQCTSIDQKKDLLIKMILWTRRINLRASDESKILLLWDKILELSSALVFQDEQQVVKQEIVTFCCELETLSEDRAGFLSVIGFGTVSNLSVNFRFLCRVMIAFLFHQFPENNLVRIEPACPGNASTCSAKNNVTSEKYLVASTAVKALDNLKGLFKKKSYAALYSQLDYAVKCITDSKYTFLDSRKILKYFAVLLYPKDSYLSTLNC